MERVLNVITSTTKRFTDYPLAPDVIEALTRAGIERPTPIQESCIPAILEGRDMVGQAETGTGKTIGFGAPVVGKIDTQRVSVQALVLTPTRELAQQVAGVFEQLGAGRNLGVALIVGGVHASDQILKLRSGTQVVVGTPGRILEFIEDRVLSLVWCEVAVLDEADRMLDMGFIDDVTKILDSVPEQRQTLLFSATIPPEVERILHKYMKDPIVVSTSQGLATVPEIQQFYVEAGFPEKFRALQKILDSHADASFLIFCNTRRQAIDLDRMLWGHGYSAASLHGDHEQDVRFKVLESFRKGDVKILVATDVASRGLDVDDISFVVNYEIPEEAESYVHRIGRTGRAKKSGVAISIVSGKEWSTWRRIVEKTGFQVERMGPERVRKGGDRGERHGRRGGREEQGHGRLDRQGRRGDSRQHSGSSRGGRFRPGRGSGRGMPVGPGGQRPEAPAAQPVSSGLPDGEPRPVALPDGSGPSSGGPIQPPAVPGAESQQLGGAGAWSAAAGSAVPGQADRKEAGGHPRGGGRDRSGRRRRGRGRGPRPAQGPEASARRPAASHEARAGEPEGGSRPEPPEGKEVSEWAGGLLDRPKAPKPTRIRLDEMDDDFVKTDYFQVDHSVLKRGEPVRMHGDEGGGRGEHHGRPRGGGHERRAHEGPRTGPRGDLPEAGPKAGSAPSRGGGGPSPQGSSRKRRRRRRPR